MRDLNDRETEQVAVLTAQALAKEGEKFVGLVNSKLGEQSFRIVLIDWRDSLQKVQEKVNAVKP